MLHTPALHVPLHSTGTAAQQSRGGRVNHVISTQCDLGLPFLLFLHCATGAEVLQSSKV
jgi:hypothetical protein